MIGRETVRKWMVEDSLWLSRKRTFHQPRLRRESVGELIQIDGSQHRWLEDRAEPCTLLVFIEDATSRLTQLRFVPSESTSSYFEVLQGYLESHGCPVRVLLRQALGLPMNRDAKGGQGMTQFGRALSELNDRKQIILERNVVTEELAGKYVELYDFPDRPLDLHWKGVSLPYRVFSKDQRVSHTAIVENKRLGHALALVKAHRTSSKKLRC